MNPRGGGAPHLSSSLVAAKRTGVGQLGQMGFMPSLDHPC